MWFISSLHDLLDHKGGPSPGAGGIRSLSIRVCIYTLQNNGFIRYTVVYPSRVADDYPSRIALKHRNAEAPRSGVQKYVTLYFLEGYHALNEGILWVKWLIIYDV